jgi:transcriptional regulator with XRE-family HTH domain
VTSPIILGKPKRAVLGGLGAALLQIKNARKLTLDEMAEAIGRSDEMLAQYIAGEAEMGVTAWLRACEAWPDLAERVSYNLDEAEKAFRARQRELRLHAPTPESEVA